MPKAYAIGHMTLTNAEKFMTDCGSKVEGSIKAFGGKFLASAGDVSYQEGDPLG